MSDVIERHGGTLDKFIGDGMMATFGAPDDDPYQEERAVRAALDLQEKIGELSAKAEGEIGQSSISGLGFIPDTPLWAAWDRAGTWSTRPSARQ